MEAGESLDQVAPSDVPSFADFMFSELVDTPETPEKPDDRAVTLKQRCAEVFEAAGIKHDHRLQRDSEVFLSIGRKSCPVRYDYVWGEGRYDALIQRVVLKDQKSVLSTYSMHEHVKKSNVNANCQRVSVVNSADYELDDSKMRIGMLSSVGPVVDICDISNTAGDFRRLLKL